MSRARFSADAEANLLAIVEVIAQDNPNAARDWLDTLEWPRSGLTVSEKRRRPPGSIRRCVTLSVATQIAAGARIAR
jgi:plasmid stabilization system protein ParE